MLKEAVKAVAAASQAPEALAASSALSVASLCVQAFANVETLNCSSTSPLSLFCLSSAVSGERKTASFKPFVEPIERFEQEEATRHLSQSSNWKIEYAEWKGRSDRLQKKLSSKNDAHDANQVKADLAELGPEPIRPHMTDRTITEPTFEALIQVFETGQPSIGIFTDEGGQFLGGHAMSAENQQKTLAGMNKLWSGDPIKRTRVRSNDGHSTLIGKRLATHLMVQPDILRNFMSRGCAEEIGFLPRFLLCEPDTKVGTRLYQEQRPDMTSVKKFADRVREILGARLPVSPGTMSLVPRTLRLSNFAHKKLIRFYNSVEVKQTPSGEYDSISGYASKIAEQAARLAGVLTLWQDLNAEEVSEENMENAIELAGYYLSEAVRIGGEVELTKTTLRAETLRK